MKYRFLMIQRPLITNKLIYTARCHMLFGLILLGKVRWMKERVLLHLMKPFYIDNSKREYGNQFKVFWREWNSSDNLSTFRRYFLSTQNILILYNWILDRQLYKTHDQNWIQEITKCIQLFHISFHSCNLSL